MGNRFASGYKAIAECDRCGFRFKLKQLRKLVVKDHLISTKVCNACWDPDHPQLKLGMFPVDDPQALREPRPDLSYYSSGVNNNGVPSDGSRVFQWGWAPIGGAQSSDNGLTPNYLAPAGVVSNVTITTT